MDDSGVVLIYTLNNGDTRRVVVLTEGPIHEALQAANTKALMEGWAGDIDEAADIQIGRITDLVRM